MDVFLARQAIFDRNLSLFGYELLFRSCQRNSVEVTDDTASTLQVLSSSLLSSGLEALACNAPVFINFGQELLTTQWTSLFPPKSVVIEILESVRPSPEVIASCLSLRKLGYMLALDDVVGDGGHAELINLANFIKIDFRSTSKEEQARLGKIFKANGKRLIAEKVETHEEFAWAREAGYDYFQGFFFARPTLLKGQNIPSVKVNSLRLLRELQYEDLNFDRIETLIRCDISLTYKLFRYVNSALFTRSAPISSIRDGLVVMGELDIRRWITLATLPGLAIGSTRELMVHALVRGRFCEILASAAKVTPASDAFLVGMFSLLDALVDRPLADVVVELNLPASIRAPLLGTAGPTAVAIIYQIALRYEAGDWDALDALLRQLLLPKELIADSYLQAITWCNEMFTLVGSEPNAEATKTPITEGPRSSELLAIRSALGASRGPVHSPLPSSRGVPSRSR